MTARAERSETGAPTAVLLCAGLESCGYGVDLSRVRHALQETVPPVRVHIVPDLCAHPRRIATVLQHGASAVVLGVCADRDLGGELQTALRQAGVDPVGVEVVDLGSFAALVHPRREATEKAAMLLTAAVARARAFGGSRPEHLKPVLAASVSRWSLINLSLLEYQTVPAVRGARCRAEQGCRECAALCPRQALRVEDGEIELEKSRCTGCGICVTGCPHDAMDFPGYAPEQIAAQVAALLAAGPDGDRPRALLFVCRDGAGALQRVAGRQVTYPAHWLPVEVPCAEMVPAVWLLAALALGAAAVGIVPCTPECRCGGSVRTAEQVDYCRELLGRLGGPAERVLALPADPDGLVEALRSAAVHAQPPARPALADPFQQRARAQVVLQLARDHGGPAGISLVHPASPFGTVEVTSGCTLCGVCAAACPAGALLVERNGAPALSFDAAACTACGKCQPVCPEPGVLHLRRVTDLERLARGRTVLVRDQYRRCLACGAPIAPEAMLKRISALLGEEYAATAGVISRYCLACRGGTSHE